MVSPCVVHIECRYLDARRRSFVADDLAHTISAARCINTVINEPSDFFLAFPAGALADMVDRRRLLIATQCWMPLVAGFRPRLPLRVSDS